LRTTLLTLAILFFLQSNAGKITGTVTDSSGQVLSFSSIQVKGTSKGTTANVQGKFSLELKPGTYTLVCQHVNYKRAEQTITVGNEDITVNFKLVQQDFVMQEVVIKRGEDPAYEIIRKTIKKRKEHKDELKKFTVEVYTKGQTRLRDFPDKFMGKKVDIDEDDPDDTTKNRIMFLSESISKYSVDDPKYKIEVLATKVSGRSEAYGLASPQIINFYENNLNFGTNLNPRGFISPIADNALNFYRYKYEGSFQEEGRLVSKIKVTPKRKWEPLFSGHINIIEDEWRIHSLQLLLTKESQMDLLDSLRLEQLHVPAGDRWVVRSQVIYPTIKIFGFDTYGNFVNVYSSYDLNPGFSKDHFNKTILKYYDSSNKKTTDYWNSSRPLVLQEDEEKDYQKKDSIEIVRKSPKYLDSLDRKANKISPMGVLVTGEFFTKRKKRLTYSIPGLLQMTQFNTVEGLVIDFQPTIIKRLDSSRYSWRSFSITPTLRYGFSNELFSPSVSMRYTFGKKTFSSIALSGGRDVFQFNNAQPIAEKENTFQTLYFARNYMKVYSADFFNLSFTKSLGDGFSIIPGIQFQDRKPLTNTTDYVWRNKDELVYTPNYPVDLTNSPMQRHQAFIARLGFRFQPGVKYIELPEQRYQTRSGYPVFTASITKGFKNILGSDISYARWDGGMTDDVNLKLGGTFSYKVEVGGFINRDSVQIPDYTHFNGNQLYLSAAPYLNSFQLAPYYRYSNTESIYTRAHVEHHFNGLLTNKIPLFRKLNWTIVAGSNTFFVNRNNYYAEAFVGLENIFKLFRLDFINGYEPNGKARTGIRLGMNGAFFNRR
jgi:hypothetical protein